jgi:hypothetical protein
VDTGIVGLGLHQQTGDSVENLDINTIGLLIR